MPGHLTEAQVHAVLDFTNSKSLQIASMGLLTALQIINCQIAHFSFLPLISAYYQQQPTTRQTSANEAQTRTLPYYSSAMVLSVQKPPKRAFLKSHQVETPKKFILPFTLLPNQHKGIWSLTVLTLTGNELLIVY